MHTKNSSEVAKPAILLLILISTSLLIISLAYFGYKNSKTALAASTIVVNSTADVQLDDGECTLREAIVASNTDTASGALAGECIAGSGDDTINFNIPGAGVRTIVPLSALPPVEAKVDINGYSQPGAKANTAIAPAALNGNLLIEIDGTNVANYALLFDGDATGSSGSSVRGLVINRFGKNNTIIVGANNIAVAGNYIGTDPTGLIDLGNAGPGITSQFGSSNSFDAKIGGLSPADRNLISGNEDAGSYPSDGWLFQGNYIGVDATGLVAMGNSTKGASGGISADECENVTIGGDQQGAINVISGNNSHGIAPHLSINTIIAGNYIGVGADGTTPIPNLAAGIVLTGSTNALIGGSTAGSDNTIANSGLQGIYLGTGNDGVVVDSNTVVSNAGGGIYMQGGTNTAITGNTVDSNGANGINTFSSASNVTIKGNTANSNSEMGILIDSSSYVTIGGSAPGEGNSANNNTSHGIGLHNSSTQVVVRANTIDGNASNGIDVYNLVSDSSIVGNTITKNYNGIQIDSSSNIVIGGTAEGSSNTINSNTGDGIYIYNFSSNVSLQANQITSNGSRGLYVNNSSNIDFGTESANSGNTVDSNTSEGVLVSTSSLVKLRKSVVTNNAQEGIKIISSDATAISGGSIESNTNGGVAVTDSSDVVISSTTISQNQSTGALIQNSPGAIITGSTITSNNSDGIYFEGSDTGTVKGSSILNNSLNGLVLFNSSSAQIGGVTQADRNIISGNLGRANVSILGFGGAAENNIIQGNYIGTATNGSYDPSIQQGFGVSVAANSNSNVVGGSSQGAGNIIAGNKGAGVLVNSVTTPEPDSVTLAPVNNAILGNSILSNQSSTVDSLDYPGLGIDLAGTVLDENYQVASGINVGPTPNDVADPDTGSNIYMNFPVLNSAVQNGTKVTMNLSLDAEGTTDAGGLYRVELFANDSADPSGYGEGQTYLGYAMVANGENQEIDFTIPAGINLTGKALSATTTSLNSEITSGFGSSSELSLATTNIRVIEQPSGLAITGQNLILFILATGSLVLAGLVTLYNSLVKSLPPGGSAANNISLIIARLQAKILQSLQNFYRILGWR
ncbi:MAG: right-handed parallel beta-helix repeat-containing protein [Patescibacteria group bacterium]|nr:right-handed parallel beta-helix repeat-containing protein [Patescibacteria group bacterium]